MPYKTLWTWTLNVLTRIDFPHAQIWDREADFFKIWWLPGVFRHKSSHENSDAWV